MAELIIAGELLAGLQLDLTPILGFYAEAGLGRTIFQAGISLKLPYHSEDKDATNDIHARKN